MRDDRQRLLDILEAIAGIEKYATRGQAVFSDDELIRIWIAYHLQVIGEAAAGPSSNFREEHGQIPWRRIVGMRNILVHQYFGIDWNEIWHTVAIDIPELKKQVKDIFRQTDETAR